MAKIVLCCRREGNWGNIYKEFLGRGGFWEDKQCGNYSLSISPNPHKKLERQDSKTKTHGHFMTKLSDKVIPWTPRYQWVEINHPLHDLHGSPSVQEEEERSNRALTYGSKNRKPTIQWIGITGKYEDQCESSGRHCEVLPSPTGSEGSAGALRGPCGSELPSRAGPRIVRSWWGAIRI